MSLAPGARLGAYEILSLLDAGGMGEVYLAHDPRLRRNVAIKVLPQEFARDASRLKRFEREARAVAALTHPNILAVYDIGRHDDTHFIVMEYVRGETLAAYLLRERPSWARALEIGAEIADALECAHGSKLVHRDLKPRNVMMTPDGHVKVLDFGLAKTFADEGVTTTTTFDTPGTIAGQVLGTPGYMSPEQMLGEPVDHLTDIYSLGVILFELVTGQRLFPNMPWHELWYATLTAPVRAARDVDPSVPVAISDIIARATARDPSARPKSATAFKTELRQLIGSDGRAEPASSPIEKWRAFRGPWRASRGARYGVASFVAVAAIVVMATSIWRQDSPEPVKPLDRPVIAVLPFANLSGDNSKAYLGVGIADTLTTSLGRLSSVSVVSRATMQSSRERSTTAISKIARELGATLLVQGSVQQSGDRLRVSANLVTPDGRVQWSGDSEAGLADHFLLESRLANALVEALRITVSDAERQRLARPPTGDRGALEAYWQGMALLDRTDNTGIDQAVVYFQRAIALDDQFSLAHAALGEAYRRKFQTTNDAVLMKSAVDEVSKALQLDPGLPEVRLSLATVYNATGRNGAAVEQLRQALVDQPLNDEAHRLLGDVLASEGQTAEALTELHRAVSLRPQYWRNQQSLGVFYLRTRKLPEAVDALTRLTELNPEDANPYQQLGAAYQMLGDNVRARQNYERSLAVRPNPDSYANIGTIQYSEGRFAEAAEAYEQAIRLTSNRALYHRNLGDAYLKLGRRGDANAAYGQAVRFAEARLTVNPNDATTMSQLGVYEAKVGKRREAERHSSAAVVINPASPEILYRRAVVLALNGDRDRALSQMSEAIAKGYSKGLAIADDDLAALRSLPAFKSLVSPAQ